MYLFWDKTDLNALRVLKVERDRTHFLHIKKLQFSQGCVDIYSHCIKVITHFCRILVDVYVNNSSMFFALFDDIILYLHVPARFVFPTKQHIKKFLLTRTYLIWHHIHQGKGRNVLIISATHICGLNMLESCKQCVARGWVGRFIAWFIPWLGRRGGADEAVSGTKTQITVTITGKHHIVGAYIMRFRN